MTPTPTNVSEGVATCTCGELKPGYGHSERCPTLTSLVDANGKPKIAPVQGYIAGIPWSIQLRAYDAYRKKWSSQAALIDLDRRGCRGGFGVEELDEFVPGWRDEVSEITALRARIAELEAATPSPPLPSLEVEREALWDDAKYVFGIEEDEPFNGDWGDLAPLPDHWRPEGVEISGAAGWVAVFRFERSNGDRYGGADAMVPTMVESRAAVEWLASIGAEPTALSALPPLEDRL